MVVTRLERFLTKQKIKPAHLALKSGYSRQHLLRIRKGEMDPTRKCIAAIVTAVAKLSNREVQPEELFVLSSENSGESERRLKLSRQAAAMRKGALGTARRLISSLDKHRVPLTKWLTEIESNDAVTEPVALILVERSRALIQSQPRRAEQMLQIAIAIAQRLDHDATPVVAVHGRAHLYRGNALANLSDYDAAFHSFDDAEAILTESVHCLIELGQVWYSRARTLVRRNAYLAARQWLRRSSVIFRSLNDDRMTGLSQLLEGVILYEEGNATSAERLLRSTLDALERSGDKAALASAWLNMGRCHIELGDAKAARIWLDKARTSFSRLGADAEVVRARWCLAWLRALHEDTGSGLRLLWESRRDFERLEMPTDAALVGLDIVEVLLIGETPEMAAQAASVCRSIIDNFQQRGEAANARRAVAHLREALRQGGARRDTVQEVRRFLRRWSNDPSIVFQPEGESGIQHA